MNIYLCQTYRHLYMSLSLCLANKSDSNVIIIDEDHQGINPTCLDLVSLKGRNTKVFFVSEKTMMSDIGFGNLLGKVSLFKRQIYLSMDKLTWIDDLICNYIGEVIFGSERDLLLTSSVFVFHDGHNLSRLKKRIKNVLLIEDGMANYSRHKVTSRLKFINRLACMKNPFSYVMGDEKNISKVLLLDPSMAPESIKNKVEHLVCDPIGKNLKTIKKIFKYDVKLDGVHVIFLTQNLSVAEICSREDKIKVYLKVLRELHERLCCDIALKLHPSEVYSEYSEVLDLNYIHYIPNKLPFELIERELDSNVLIISLYSSTVLSKEGKTVNLLANGFSCIEDIINESIGSIELIEVDW